MSLLSITGNKIVNGMWLLRIVIYENEKIVTNYRNKG
jgi:hypothetical protein